MNLLPRASRILIQLLSLVCALLPGMTPAEAQPDQPIRVVEVIWGFDRRVVPGQFQPLSILLDNLSDEAIEGEVRLRSVSGMIRDTGGTAVQEVFIGPNSRRWVQFYPYVSGGTATWRLTLRTEEGRTFTFEDMDQPRPIFSNESGSRMGNDPSLPAVILDPTGVPTRVPTTIKHLPAEVFPPYATATHGLYALFLDHVPDWEAPRQAALLGWLKAGGRLHLMLDQNSQPLRFSGLLAPLNDPFPQFRVDQGTVFRHDFQRAGLTEQLVNSVTTHSARAPEDPEDLAERNRSANSGFLFRTGVVDDSEVLSLLREQTQPDHAWWLIFLLSMVYVGLIFPGCWILSKQRTLHFLVTYAAIAGLSLTFSLMFLLIGRRGYGESTSVQSLSVARAEDATTWNVFRYDNLFVTSGDRYVVEDRDHEAMLASGALDESVDAQVTSGNNSVFATRIPPFSSQSVLSLRRMTLPDWQLRVVSVAQAGGSVSGLTIGHGPAFPTGPDVKCYFLHGRTVFEATSSAERREIVQTGVGQRLSSFCQPGDPFNGTPVTVFGMQPRKDDEDPVDRFERLALPHLALRMMVDDLVQKLPEFRLPDDRVRLLVYAPAAPELELNVNTEARRAGRILYVRELSLTANPGDADVSADAIPGADAKP